MDPMEQLQEINSAFQELLAFPQPADLSPAHKGDDLMVWFLLGGKDVGKSTFLNALLDREVSREPPESAEGTSRFVAYIHESAGRELTERLQGLPITIHLHAHESESHRRLCLIDSPDFDSRFEHHASQVAQVLKAGAADGAVLLASPEKYKNMTYWNTFHALSGALSPRHILFVLTKADELGDYLQDVRTDFLRTVVQRMDPEEGKDGQNATRKGREDPQQEARIFLIDSLKRAVDFSRLEARLLRKLSEKDVRSAQQENLHHALTLGATRIREHYGLEEIGKNLKEAAVAQRIDDICREAFPNAYFHTVASRITGSRDVAALIRERAGREPSRTLAGIPAIQSAIQWLAARNPLRLRSDGTHPVDPGTGPDLGRLTRWGEEDLDRRLERASRDALSGLWLENPEALEPFTRGEGSAKDELAQCMEDLLAGPARKTLSLPMRLLLNLPIYLYLVFFLTLLFSPVFLLLKAWDVPHMPDLTGLLSLDNVKVAVIGFLGYYLMALFFVLRKQRDRVHREMEELAKRFTSDMLAFLREAVRRPFSRFEEAFTRLEERLDRTF